MCRVIGGSARPVSVGRHAGKIRHTAQDARAGHAGMDEARVLETEARAEARQPEPPRPDGVEEGPATELITPLGAEVVLRFRASALFCSSPKSRH